MNQKILKDYFSFTKKERVAVLCLVAVSILLFVLPSLLPESKQVKITPEYLLPTRMLASDEHGDSLQHVSDPTTAIHEKYLRSSLDKSRLFYFDPNVLTPAGWEKIGLRPKAIHTIQNYLSKGGRFRSPDDLGKIYGLHEDEINRLVPYVRIMENRQVKAIHERSYKRPAFEAQSREKSLKRYRSVIDINTADTTQLIALPGIGSKLSMRIIRFRQQLGGFYAIQQLSEVYGLPDSTFQMIIPRLSIAAAPPAGINLNTADENQLKSHPYIKWQVAKAIISYRKQHGNFKDIDELKQLDCIDAELFKKIAHYVMVLAD